MFTLLLQEYIAWSQPLTSQLDKFVGQVNETLKAPTLRSNCIL